VQFRLYALGLRVGGFSRAAMLWCMGNRSLKPGIVPDNKRIAPPIAPPAQPGEVRGCKNCARCLEIIPIPTTAQGCRAECEWQGEWWDVEKGCDRWALKSQ